MNELALKYGCNPNQKPSKIFMQDGKDLPVEVLNGKPGYINFLDAFNSWQLVKELKAATGLPAAASLGILIVRKDWLFSCGCIIQACKSCRCGSCN